MKRHAPELDPEIEALLKPHRIQRQMPSALRERVIARARATLAGEPIAPAPTPPAAPIVRGRGLLRFTVAASIVIAGAAAGAVAGLHVRGARAPERAPDAVTPVRGPVTSAVSPAAEPPSLQPAPIRPLHSPRPGGKRDRFTAELVLMQRAHAAFTRHDFSVALTVVAEHARRFPAGQLAEQREALRVRALLGAGRADEAQHAAAAFAIRFPRSVLLQRVQGGQGGQGGQRGQRGLEGSESSER